MAHHGFRVFVVEAFRNRTKDRPAENMQAGSATATELLELLEELHHGGTVRLDPPPVDPDADEPQKRAQTATLGPIHVINEHMLHFTFYRGEFGEHAFGRHPTKAAQDLEEWSAEAGHYMAIFFPKLEESRFIVVAQTIRQRDHTALLLRILRDRSLARKKAAKEAEESQREAAREAGEKVPPRRQHSRLLFQRRQAADNAYLDEIVSDSRSAVAEFEARVPSPRNGNQTVVQRKLQISLLDKDEKKISTTVGRRWAGRSRRGQATTKAKGVSELAELLTEHDLMTDEESAGYTDAAVAVVGSSGTRTRIAVDALRDVFTYPVSDGPPSAYHHYKKVAPRLQIIAAEEEVELDTLDPLEVELCLVD